MDKKISDTLEKLKKYMIKDVEKTFNEALKEEAQVSIKKYKDGNAVTTIEGNTMAVLIVLSALEKSVLERLHVPNDMFNFIKENIGTMEVKQ